MPAITPSATGTDGARRWPGPDGLAFHALTIAFIIGTQILYTPARDLGPDNTWHYRLASDIVTGVPVYWAGLDGNRLFPDILFALAAFVLSGQSLFEGWLPFFYALFFLALYASLIGLAAALYATVPERRAFALLSVAGLWAFELAAPFWPRWFFDPGNHGTGLPVVFACLALAFWMNRLGRFSLGAGAVFVLAASLVVGSNRFLLLVFLVPLFGALLAVLASRWAVRQGYLSSIAAKRDLAPLPALVLLTCAAAAGSYIAYRSLGDLSWHKGTTFMGAQIVDRGWSLDWAWQKLLKEAGDLMGFFFEKSWQVVVGPLLLLATVPPALVLLVRAMRRSSRGAQESRAVFGLFTALAAVLSIAFVVWAWEETSEWRYRYFAMATAFSVVFLVSFLVRPALSLPRPGWFGAGALLTLAALTVIPAVGGDARGRAERHGKFVREVDEIGRWVAARTTAIPIRGLSEYWAGMDITARTDLRIDSLDEKARARFYNSNAGALCLGGYSFILRKTGPDSPRRHEILALLGEPQATKTMELEGHQGIELMAYDPAAIQSRIIEEGKKEATRLFPNFSCPR